MPERRPRVLMTLADVAWPIDAGKRLRAASMVRAVAASCDLDVVVLYADADPRARPVPPDVNANWTVIAPSRCRNGGRPTVGASPGAVAGGCADWTPAVEALKSAAAGKTFDVMWFGALDHFEMLRDTVPARRVIVDCDDVETEKLRRFLDLPSGAGGSRVERIQRRIELPLWGSIQRRSVRRADAVLVCSALDRTRLAEQAAGGDAQATGRIVSVTNTYPEPPDVAATSRVRGCTVTVIANFGTDQNLDAAEFAAREVLPELRRVVPGARIRLVGRRPDRLAAYTDIEGLDVVGPVDSVADELARADIVLVPIRFGGGTRLKVIEAFAYGVPVVSTAAGAEGIDAVDGDQLLLAETPAQIAAAVRRIVDDPELRATLTRSGHDCYEQTYRPEATVRIVGQLLDALTSRP